MGNILKIDRIRLFDTTVTGPCSVVINEDKRSLSIKEIDFERIRLRTVSDDSTCCVDGFEKVRRVKDLGYYILPDIAIFETIWSNTEFIPEEWKRYNNPILFAGTIIRCSDANIIKYYDSVPGIYWGDGGGWHRHFFWLGHERCRICPFAVIVP